MKICKAKDCKNKISKHRTYCSGTCRTRTTNFLYKDYKEESAQRRAESESKHTTRYCLECKSPISFRTKTGYISGAEKFCSSSCRAIYNNRKRKESGWRVNDNTKERIRQSILNYCRKIGLKIHEKKPPKYCIICSELLIGHQQRFCGKKCIDKDKLVNKISKAKDPKTIYRLRCNFKFDPYDYPDKFDLTLLKSHGWYRPSNRGNNLGGVSRDHLFSITDGFNQNISPNTMSHPANCDLILHSKNASKGSKSSITLKQLLERIGKWENIQQEPAR